jgi:predicted amidophosphoribosyltransferase
MTTCPTCNQPMPTLTPAQARRRYYELRDEAKRRRETLATLPRPRRARYAYETNEMQSEAIAMYRLWKGID